PGHHHALGVEQVVDDGHVHALRELLVVAQERGDVAPGVAVDVDDGLTVRLVEHRRREPVENQGRDLVRRARRSVAGTVGAVFVNLFTSVVVGHRRRRAPGYGWG